MKKILIVALMLWGIMFYPSCKGTPTTPDPPDPPKKYFNIQIIYIRPFGSILRPELKDVIILAFIDNHCYDRVEFDLKRIDDYHFESEFESVADNEDGPLYTLWGSDMARDDFSSGGLSVVGDIFILRVKETGLEKQLFNIQQNPLWCAANRGPNSKMALFRLKKDGTITDE